MNDVVVRLIIVLVAVIAALGFARVSRSRRALSQPPVDVSGLGLESPVVAFTSKGCENCMQVMALLASVGAQVREVSFDLDPELFEAAGVEAVPLVVVVDRDGNPVWQRGGKLTGRTVRRALARAGW